MTGETKEANTNIENTVNHEYADSLLSSNVRARLDPAKAKTLKQREYWENQTLQKYREDRKRYGNRKTGFDKLDAKAGNLLPGMYVVGGESTIGKTGYCLQMCDQLALQNVPVMFITLEQTENFIVAKTLCRLAAKDAIKDAKLHLSEFNATMWTLHENNFTYLPTVAEICFGSERLNAEKTKKALDAAEIKAFEEAEQTRKALKAAEKLHAEKIAPYQSIVEGRIGLTVGEIIWYIEEFMSHYDVPPVVCVDYLQHIQYKDAGFGSMMNPFENTARVMDALTTFAARNDITMFLITSVNRTSYNSPLTMGAGKNAGNIEYDCDVLDFLEFTDRKETEKDKDEQKREEPRKITMTRKKNRFGVASFKHEFLYYSGFEWFVEP